MRQKSGMDEELISIGKEENYLSYDDVGDELTEEVIPPDEIDDVLDDYLQDTFWTIYSRVPDDARIVVELVKQHLREIDAQL